MHDSKDGGGRATQEAKAEEQLPNGDREHKSYLTPLLFISFYYVYKDSKYFVCGIYQ